MPARVLRQFGFVQVPPSDPFHPKEVYRGPETSRYKCKHDDMRQLWDAWHNYLIKPLSMGSRRLCYATEVDHDYLEWYMTVMHCRVLSRYIHDEDEPCQPKPREMPVEVTQGKPIDWPRGFRSTGFQT
ncbi:hypothetical protein Dimus_029052, partial [Dionaea muscipula]